MPEGVAWLFCPANKPGRFAKAADRADVVILDLEDAVGPGDRPAARRALAEQRLDPDRTVVRINPAGSPDHDLDLAALNETSYTTVMLAKTESAADARALAPLRVVALCETPAGVRNAGAIAATGNVEALMWGAEDLIAALGGTSSRFPGGRYRDVARHARSSVLLAAGAAGKLAIDAVYLDIPDLDGLNDESIDAAASGFGAKACIHPSQVPIVRAAYAPTSEELHWANRVLAASASGGDAFTLDGRMIDEPVLRQARRILARAVVR
ncbi:HpcH/HpaI aldolase/citrate lyase family protein [Dactylosporangium sp. CA-092794]|uniref:HpcH/HpaI aldolase/citrate lyase family protein n=1 Tax=Dactylosporangium sp. CA-092794 TaxID=3239929 RepID=UPI003D920AF2